MHKATGTAKCRVPARIVIRFLHVVFWTGVLGFAPSVGRTLTGSPGFDFPCVHAAAVLEYSTVLALTTVVALVGRSGLETGLQGLAAWPSTAALVLQGGSFSLACRPPSGQVAVWRGQHSALLFPFAACFLWYPWE